MAMIPALVLAADADADVLPIEAFVERESPHSVTISPSGEYLGLIVAEDERDYLVVLDRESLQAISRTNARADSRIGDYYWVNQDRIVFEDARRSRQSPYWVIHGELFAVNADGSDPLHLFGYSIQHKDIRTRPQRPALMGSKTDSRRAIRAWAEMLAPRVEDPRLVTIAAYPYREEAAPPWVFDLDVYDGTLSERGQGPVVDARLIADERGVVRCAYAASDGDQVHAYFRAAPDAPWGLHHTWDPQAGAVLPVLCPSNRKVFALDFLDTPSGLTEFDPETGESRLLHRDAEQSIVDWVATFDRRGIAAVRYEEPESHFITIDESSRKARALHALQDAFPADIARIVSGTTDGRFAVGYIRGLGNPGDYYLYDVEAMQASYLFSRRERLDPQALGAVSRIVVASGDDGGTWGYLTLPPDADSQRLPFLIVLQDGPRRTQYSRDFDSEAHLFASRGYAVLRLTYRDPESGLKYSNGSDIEDVQQDVLAAARWAIDRGVADPDRIAVYGFGFGGLMAIMSTIDADTPFSCALAYTGVLDLEHMIDDGFRDQSDYLRRHIAGIDEFYMGIIGSDRERLREQSPLWRTSDMQRPVFVAHGGKSSRPLRQASQFVKALEKNKITVETHIRKDQPGRFIATKENVELYEHMFEFLDRQCVREQSGS